MRPQAPPKAQPPILAQVPVLQDFDQPTGERCARKIVQPPKGQRIHRCGISQVSVQRERRTDLFVQVAPFLMETFGNTNESSRQHSPYRNFKQLPVPPDRRHPQTAIGTVRPNSTCPNGCARGCPNLEHRTSTQVFRPPSGRQSCAPRNGNSCVRWARERDAGNPIRRAPKAGLCPIVVNIENSRESTS